MTAVKPISNWIVQENEGSKVKSGVRDNTMLLMAYPHRHAKRPIQASAYHPPPGQVKEIQI